MDITGNVQFVSAENVDPLELAPFSKVRKFLLRNGCLLSSYGPLKRRTKKSSGLTVDRQASLMCQIVTDLTHPSKMDYYSRMVADHQRTQKGLFATVDKFLHLKGESRKAPLV